MFSIDNFIKERNEALFSLDKEKIKAYAKKYDVPLPESEYPFWKGVYLALLNIKSTPATVLKEAENKAFLAYNKLHESAKDDK